MTTERKYLYEGLSACQRQIAQIKDTLTSARHLQNQMKLQLQETHDLLIKSDETVERSRKLLEAQDGMSTWMARQETEKRKTRSCVAALEDALARCRHEDVRTLTTYAALHFLGTRAKEKWPFEQFRNAIEEEGPERWQIERRWQLVNAALNAIKLSVKKLT